MPRTDRYGRRPALGFRPGLTEDWRILRALTLYRLLLITLLLTLLESGVSLQLFEAVEAGLFRRINQAYAIASLLLLLPLRLQLPRIALQTLVQFGVDLAGITALVYSTGGVENGLGILLITPTVAAALILTPRLATVCAAAATLVMFAEELLRPLGKGISPVDMTSTGLLGLMLFATSIAASAVAARARKSEALVAQADSEVASLSQLNESIIESMQTGVMVVDDEGEIRLLNAAAQRLMAPAGRPGQRLAIRWQRRRHAVAQKMGRLRPVARPGGHPRVALTTGQPRHEGRCLRIIRADRLPGGIDTRRQRLGRTDHGRIRQLVAQAG